MNLYFRMLLILLRSKFASKIGLLDVSRSAFRVWPLDSDINLHLTNARYFAFCDLSRIYYLNQVGVLSKLLKRKWLPIVQAQEVSYIKPIRAFRKFEILTRFSHWDDKYWYTEHQFMAGGNLCAVVQARGVFVDRKAVLPFRDVLALADERVDIPDKPIPVGYWQKLIESKKEHSATNAPQIQN